MKKANIEVYCLSYFYSKPDHREKLINSLLALIAPTRAEKGCLQYDLLIDKDDPNLLIMLEKFSNLKALKKHEQMPYVKHFAENEMNQYCEKVSWNVAIASNKPIPIK